ncbi:hypothetical protein FB565_002929 [Actinoplanes lutulentus]|uniref:Uncharacterized protein n=1 Tax=Actinoplanes lutulentus TaxID=1287878 RepID=A0A327Z172_9ACTN|nr:hypothetical protein [Actinoplanes lutulentus]MBB2943216.1 hypothetical protein [Actinoplanes lutulentus]RAK28282.1 hypothetical protein B0I29_12050 [Actinoplanes lutulentus]
MDDLVMSARAMVDAADASDHRAYNVAARDFVERVTFATADDITGMLREVFAADWMAMPPWARNLSYRLACLQRPDDAQLLQAAAVDLYSFGPDWDEHAERLSAEAGRIQQEH